MSRPKESICPRCALNMEAQRIGKDSEGKPFYIYVCHSCNPEQSGAAEHYEQCVGWRKPKRGQGW